MSLRADDLRAAFRSLRKHPLESVSALLILALGIGATSAAFSLVDGVVLRPLPYPEPDRLVVVHEVTPSGWEIPVSPARWALWAESAAAAGGLGVAWAGVELMRALFGRELPRIAEVGIDGRVFAFTVAVTALAVLLAGLVPAWQTARRALAAGVRRERHALRRLLLVAEVAVAMVLVVGAGLLGRSLLALSAVDPGFEPAGRLALELSVDPERYPEAAGRQALFDGVLERVRALPGVRQAALATFLPFGRGLAVVTLETPGSEETLFASLVGVGPDYFRVLGIPPVEGRAIGPDDRAAARPVAVVSEATARTLWPGESAVGRRIPVGGDDDVEVVGVVEDVRLQSLAKDPSPTVYRPFEQVPGSRAAVVARTGVVPDLLVQPFREAVWTVDPEQPVARVAPLAELLGDSLREPRASSTLFGLFAVFAALLSALGLYGLMAELVSRRTHELGVRMALGAGRGRVVGLVMRRSLGLAAAGVAAGGLAAAAASRLLQSLLFGVRPTDPATYAAVAALLLAVASLAAWAPALRAARTDPVVALKTE